MEKAPPVQGTLASDDEESPAFLCGVAAEAVHDAIQLINGLDSEAELPLRSALEVLVRDATVVPDGPSRTGTLRANEPPRNVALSAATIDHIVEERLRQADEADGREQMALTRGLRSLMGSADPERSRAVMLMLEALAILFQKGGNSHSAAHLQMALDGIVTSQSPHTFCALEGQRKH